MGAVQRAGLRDTRSWWRVATVAKSCHANTFALPLFIVSLGENALCFVSLEARIYILFSFFFFLEGVDVSYKEMYAIKMEITGM